MALFGFWVLGFGLLSAKKSDFLSTSSFPRPLYLQPPLYQGLSHTCTSHDSREKHGILQLGRWRPHHYKLKLQHTAVCFVGYSSMVSARWMRDMFVFVCLFAFPSVIFPRFIILILYLIWAMTACHTGLWRSYGWTYTDARDILVTTYHTWLYGLVGPKVLTEQSNVATVRTVYMQLQYLVDHENG